MTNAISVYEQEPDPTKMMLALGSAIAKSKIFGCENESQGIVIAMTCMTRGVDPLSLAERNHLIKGKISMKADAMLAELHRLGGRHRIVSRTPDLAEIEIAYQGDTQRFSLSWEDAQAEPFVYEGKESDTVKRLAAGMKTALKPKYATPRSRTQMMWARVVSDGVRAMAPEVCVGSYTPEETEDIIEGDGGQVEPAASEVVAATTPPPASPELTTAQLEQFDAATGEQIRQLTALFNELQIPGDAQLKAMQKRGATDLGDLSAEAAADLIGALRSKLQATTDEGDSKADATTHAAPSDGPVGAAQVERIRAMIKQVAQQQGGPEVIEKLQAKLQSQGMKLVDLSTPDADRLERALSEKNMAMFFDATLTVPGGAAAKNE